MRLDEYIDEYIQYWGGIIGELSRLLKFQCWTQSSDIDEIEMRTPVFGQINTYELQTVEQKE